MIHLGVDFNNLQVGQPVLSLSEGAVFHAWHDLLSCNGWGYRVMIKSGNIFFLYGHLDPKYPKEVGQTIKQGEEIGRIGSEKVNGGWFPHLHLQVMHSSYVAQFRNLELLDGYVFSTDLATTAGILDPMKFL